MGDLEVLLGAALELLGATDVLHGDSVDAVRRAVRPGLSGVVSVC